MSEAILLRRIQDLESSLRALRQESRQALRGDPISGRSWEGVLAEATAVLTTTDTVTWVLNKNVARKMNAFVRWQVDGYTSAACTVTHRFYSKNMCAGLTPTATGWDTAPTTLTNATDQLSSTATGNGSDAGPMAINETYVQIDLGSAFSGYFYAERFWGGPTPATRNIAYQVSANGTDWTTVYTVTGPETIAWDYFLWPTLLTSVRYLRISVWVAAGQTATFTLRELSFFTSMKEDVKVQAIKPAVYGYRADDLDFVVATGYVDGSTTGTATVRYGLNSIVEINR